MEISNVSTTSYTSSAAALDEDEKKRTTEQEAVEKQNKTEETGDKLEFSKSDDEYSEEEVQEKVEGYIQNIMYTSNLTEASQAALQNYLTAFDVAKFIRTYGPFTSVSEISAAMYAATSGLIKQEE